MEFLKKLKSRFMGLALAAALFVPTVTLVAGEKPAPNDLSTMEILKQVITPRFITDTGSFLLTPYLMNKMGYDAQKSYGALAGQALLTPALSYLAWEGWTGAYKSWQWAKNLFSSHKTTTPEQAHNKEKEDAIRKDMRKNLIAGGIGNILTAATIKILAWENKPQDSWFSLSWKFGRLIIVNAIATGLVNKAYDRLFPKKKTAPQPPEPESPVNKRAVIVNQQSTPPPPRKTIRCLRGKN